MTPTGRTGAPRISRIRLASFAVLALASSLLCLQISWIPLAILIGKIPWPPLALFLQIAATEALPTLLPGAALLFLAWRRLAAGTSAWQWLVLLAAAPLVCLAALYTIFEIF